MNEVVINENYTYSNSNIWLNVPLPFSPHLGAFDSHPKASGSALVTCLTTPLDRICEVHLHLSASWHRPHVINGAQVRTLGR